MKKLLCVLLLLVAMSGVFATVTEKNRQEIISVDSPIWDAMQNLYIAQGLSLPSTTGPWSMAEMDLMLDRVNSDKLDENELCVYEFLYSEIKGEARLNPNSNLGIGIGLDVNAYMYAHSNALEYTSLDDFGANNDFKYAKPMFSVPLETWIGSNIYGFSSFDLGVSRTVASGNDFKNCNFFTNIIMVPPTAIGDLDLTFPHRAFGVIGGDNWYISVGRDKLRWGPGVSGNLTVGDQLPYHDNARISAFTDSFKYTFSISSFLHPMNYTKEVDKKDYIKDSWSQNNDRDGLRLFVAHRLEWRIFNKVNMALTESIMYQSKTNHIDLLILSPTAIFHNYYIRNNANSLLSLEIDYTPVQGLNLYSEFVLDEFMLPGENGSNKSGPPSAFGVIVGAKSAFAINGGMLSASAEFAYTDPYLYLRDGDGDREGKAYGVNFVVNHPDILGGNFYNDFNFLGYKYGNDCIVGSLNVGYDVYDDWNIGGSMTYIADGTYDMHTRWFQVENNTSQDPNAPTSRPNGNGSYLEGDDQNARNAVSHHFILDINGSITLFDSFSIFSELTFLNTWNYMNMHGETSSDIQFTLGLSYSV